MTPPGPTVGTSRSSHAGFGGPPDNNARGVCSSTPRSHERSHARVRSLYFFQYRSSAEPGRVFIATAIPFCISSSPLMVTAAFVSRFVTS